MAKKLKVKIVDKKEDILLETTQKSLGWMRRFQAPLAIGAALVICVAVLVVYALELEGRTGGIGWEEYLMLGSDASAEIYAGVASKYEGSSVEPWALLDRAHALSRSEVRAEKEEAIRAFEEVKVRFAENPLVVQIADMSIEGVRKELAYEPPKPPPEEEVPGEKPPAPSDEETPAPPAEKAGTEENP